MRNDGDMSLLYRNSEPYLFLFNARGGFLDSFADFDLLTKRLFFFLPTE